MYLNHLIENNYYYIASLAILVFSMILHSHTQGQRTQTLHVSPEKGKH